MRDFHAERMFKGMTNLRESRQLEGHLIMAGILPPQSFRSTVTRRNE